MGRRYDESAFTAGTNQRISGLPHVSFPARHRATAYLAASVALMVTSRTTDLELQVMTISPPGTPSRSIAEVEL